MKKINIVIPIYNEEGNIPELYKQLNEFSNNYKDSISFGFIFVNDGSRDNSHEKILSLKDDRIIYLKFSKNYGKESALIAGLDFSNDMDVDATVIIDSDLEMPISYIKNMIDLWNEGTKLVITRRVSDRNTSKIKTFLAKKYYSIFKKITKQDIVQDALDFSLMDRQVLKEVIKFRERNRFFKGIIASIGFDYKILDIEMVERSSGESSYGSFSSLFKYAFMSLASYTKVPLYISLIIGFLSAFIGFVYGIIIIAQYFISGNSVPGYSSIACILLFFFGVILIVLGVIGYYIGMILDETVKRPLYIIDEVYKSEGVC